MRHNGVETTANNLAALENSICHICIRATLALAFTPCKFQLNDIE